MSYIKALALMALLAVSACGDADLFNPNRSGPSAYLALRPTFSLISSSSSLVDINKVRVTVTDRARSLVVLTQIQDVDPAAAQWEIGLEVPPNAEYEVLIELINFANGVESVQYSGTVTVAVTSGPQPTPPSVSMVPGPPENLRVTSISISPRNQNLIETETVQLNANVGGVPNATVVWGSLNGNVATVSGSGLVTARAPGEATIVAQAGAHTDQITLTVGQRADRLELTPANATLTSIGADATFSARVLDSRGAVVPGITATLAITDPNIAAQVTPGVFRALRNGATTVTALATQRDRVLNASAPLVVEQRAVSIAIDPPLRTFESIGDTQQFTAAARDANNNPLTGVAFTWTSSNAAVAAVDANGLVTARGNGGPVTIRVSNGGNSAEASVSVNQTAATMTVTPRSVSFGYIGESTQATAVVKDARGNPIDTPIRWFVAQGPSVATVSEGGEIAAQGEGQAVVIADAGRLRAGVTVTVHRIAAKMDFDRTSLALKAGESVQVKARLYDAGGTPFEGETFTYSSANTAIASVNPTGNVTGIAAGSTEIIATARGFEARLPVSVTGTAPSGGFHIANGRVLLFSADGGTDADFKNRLVASGVFTADKIDILSMFSTLPSVSTLSQYGCVLAWTNSAPSNPVAIGDRLKEYVDAGGKVVLAVYALGVPSRPWELEGGIMSAGYSPLALSENQSNDSQHMLDFTTALTTHPIMEGVTSFTYFTNTNYTKPTLSTGATLVAKDNHGDPLIAVNANGRVVAINVWPGYTSHGTTSSKPFIDRAFANACR